MIYKFYLLFWKNITILIIFHFFFYEMLGTRGFPISG